MTTERVEIVVTENGARTVKRNIEEIGIAAEFSDKAIENLKGALAMAGAGAALVSVVNHLREVEKTSLRLQAVLERTGNTTQRTYGQLEGLASKLSDTTGRSAEEIKAAMSNLATFSSIGGENFERAIKLGIDMSEVYGYDLRGSLEAVARALDNPIKGFEMLRKRGFSLDAQQKELIKTLTKAGKSAEAQGVILKMLEDQVSGVAEAAYGPLNKAIGGLGNAWDAFVEKEAQASGFTELLIGTLNTLTATLVLLTDNADSVAIAIAGIAAPAIIAGLGFVLKILTSIAVAIAANPWVAFAAAVGAGAMAMVQFNSDATKTIDAMGKVVSMGDRVIAVFEGIKAAASVAFENLPQYILDAMSRSNLEFWKGWNQMFDKLPDGMKPYFQMAIPQEALDRAASDTGSRMYDAYVKARDEAITKLAKDAPKESTTFAPNTPVTLDPEKKKRHQFDWNDVVKDMRQQVELLKVEGDERERLAKVYQYQTRLRRDLTDAEKDVILTGWQYILRLQREDQIYEEIKGPQRNYQLRLEALLEVLDKGKITWEEYEEAVRKARIENLELDRSFGAGIQRGMLKLEDEISNFAKTSEGLVTQMANGMSDALGDFFTTGKLGWSDMESFVLSTINRMLAQQMLIMPLMRWLTGGEGAPAGGGMLGQFLNLLGPSSPAIGLSVGAGVSLASGGAALGSLDGLAGFAGGGSFEVGGSGNTDSQLVAFRASPDERVTIETPEQQRANRGVSMVMNVYAQDANSFRKSQNQIMTDATAAMSRASRRNA